MEPDSHLGLSWVGSSEAAPMLKNLGLSTCAGLLGSLGFIWWLHDPGDPLNAGAIGIIVLVFVSGAIGLGQAIGHVSKSKKRLGPKKSKEALEAKPVQEDEPALREEPERTTKVEEGANQQPKPEPTKNSKNKGSGKV